MKILLFYTSHRQVEEYKYSSKFLKRLKLNKLCDLYIHCNNSLISTDIFKYYQEFDQKNKQIHITSVNHGYMKGAINVISESIDSGIFNSYDYVIAIQPDVFITDDTYLLEVLYKNLTNDIVFFITKSLPNDERFFSTDFYIFKPKLLTKNILIDELNTFTEYPEYYDIKNSYNKENVENIDRDRKSTMNLSKRSGDKELFSGTIVKENTMNLSKDLSVDKELFSGE